MVQGIVDAGGGGSCSGGVGPPPALAWPIAPSTAASHQGAWGPLGKALPQREAVWFGSGCLAPVTARAISCRPDPAWCNAVHLWAAPGCLGCNLGPCAAHGDHLLCWAQALHAIGPGCFRACRTQPGVTGGPHEWCGAPGDSPSSLELPKVHSTMLS